MQPRKPTDDDSTLHRYRKGDVGSTSATLIVRLRDGDGMAWETFVKLYTPLVRVWCRWANRRLDEPLMRDDRKEIATLVIEKVQETLTKKKSTLEIRSLRAWLRRITENCIVDYVEKRNKRKPVWQLMSDTGHFKEPYNTGMSLDLADDHAEKIRFMRGVLDRLKLKFKKEHWEILLLAVVAGKSSEEIATIMNMKGSTVRQIRKRLPERLQREYESLGLEDEMPESLLRHLNKRTE